jgi:hypothetical protein
MRSTLKPLASATVRREHGVSVRTRITRRMAENGSGPNRTASASAAPDISAAPVGDDDRRM